MPADTTSSFRPPMPLGALALSDEIRSRSLKTITTITRGAHRIDAKLGRDSLWLFVRCADGPTYAARTAHAPGGGLSIADRITRTSTATLRLSSPLGAFQIEFSLLDEQDLTAQATVTLTPSHGLLVPYWPRDLYPLGDTGDPLAARGEILASQRGFNAPIVFAKTENPPGLAAYFQNLTALNPFSRFTETKPDGVVGGSWPELGYQPAAAPRQPAPPDHPLPGGKPIVMSDLLLRIHSRIPAEEAERGRLLLDFLSLAYRRTAVSEVEFRDWPARAEQTLRHLATAKSATQEAYGHTYVRPYLDAEPPDSMAQLAVVQPLSEYARWKGREAPILDRLRSAVSRFYRRDLDMLGRYLPNVPDEKDNNEVDSWYLYHPLANLGRLAQAGDKAAARLFFKSLPYATRAAQALSYRWPIKFDARDFSVTKAERKPGEPGQSDVGGIYAYVMLQALQLTGDESFLAEARAGLDSLKGYGFDLQYQANLVASGAVACLEFWRRTGETAYRNQSYHLLASFFHNTLFWESDIQHARNYSTLLGATCLHDGPYMAMYECWDSCARFHEYLRLGGDDIDPETHFLVAQYCRHTQHRAWFYYPAELPENALCDKPRSGKIDARLSFPLEDLYSGGDPAGKVGQEVYGCGAAWAFTTLGFLRPKNARFVVACETPAIAFDQTRETEVMLKLAGRTGETSRIRVIPDPRARIQASARTEGGERLKPASLSRGVEFVIPQRESVRLTWKRAAPR